MNLFKKLSQKQGIPMKKLLLLAIIGLSYTAQNNGWGNSTPVQKQIDPFSSLPAFPSFSQPEKVRVVSLTQNMISTDPNNPLPIAYKQEEPLVVSLEAGNLDEMMEKLNDSIEQHIVPQLKKTWQLTIGSLLNSENALRFGWPVALFGIVTISGFYAARIGWKMLEKKLLFPKPTILQPESKYGWLDRWKRSRSNYTTPSMIFDDSVKEQLEEIQEKTKNIRYQISCGKKITYDNLLLYGKPGTGKTLFAQILADNTDMDFLSVTAASLLQSGIEGIKYFDEIVAMGANSTYGVILFIDEADALFINRDMLNPESDHYKLLNHILAATGNGSSKIMVIAATNHAHIMDPAMGRRFQDRVKMPLPSEKTRKELLNLYLNQYFFDATDIDFKSTQAARTILTPARINTIAQQTTGLSHAEIKDMIVIMSKKADATQEGILNSHHVQSAIDQAIEKVAALKRDKIKLKKKKRSTPSEENTLQNL